MSSMNFPTSPSDGDVYRKWQYSAATSSWTLHGVSGVTGDLGVLTINGQTFDPMADSDLTVTVSGSGSLGVLSINGQAFDPSLDSDKSLTVTGDSNVTYGSAAPATSGTVVGEEYFVTSDGTSTGTVSAGYIWNGTTWTEQLTQVDGSDTGSDF